MEKRNAVVMAYQIATLTYPAEEVLELLMGLSYERILDLLLIMRQTPKQPIRSPLNFLRRAIDEGWSSETLPKPINRKIQNIEENFYLRKGLDPEQAKAKALQNRITGSLRRREY